MFCTVLRLGRCHCNDPGTAGGEDEPECESGAAPDSEGPHRLCTLSFELLEDQPDHALDLFVGVQRQATVGRFDVANGSVAVDFTAAGLVEQALVHAAA
jgi:hypothetical protein